MGPSTEPCGTPYFSGATVDTLEPMITVCVLLDR